MAIASLACAVAAVIAAFALVTRADRGNGSSIVIRDPIQQSEIVVAIEGEIATPGVYTLPYDARLNELIDAAGGLTDSADTTDLNLASRLQDEARIVIPVQPSERVAAPDGTPIGIRAGSTALPVPIETKIDINTADTAALESLPGIGPALATRIIEYREQNGPFTSVDELAAVKGISSSMVDEMRDLITAGE